MLREEALRLLCERALEEVRAATDAPERSEHERFGDVLETVTRRNRDIARAFDNPRRSHVWHHLLAMADLELLPPDLVAKSGAELRGLISQVERMRSDRS
ncbi:MAG: hypothetical protein P8049_09030 [Gemmatimonadota bacterium]